MYKILDVLTAKPFRRQMKKLKKLMPKLKKSSTSKKEGENHLFIENSVKMGKLSITTTIRS